MNKIIFALNLHHGTFDRNKLVFARKHLIFLFLVCTILELTAVAIWQVSPASAQTLSHVGSTKTENSLVLATGTVTNINDSGAGSLRQAILDSNGNPPPAGTATP